MTLTSWLPLYNMAIRRLGAAELTSGFDISAPATNEGRLVSRFWENALETVLADHDWPLAIRTILLGTSTTSLVPTAPRNIAEMAYGTTRRYYFPIPDYDPTNTVAGTVPFEIIRIIETSAGENFFIEDGKVFVPSQVTNTNFYARVIIKPGYAQSGRDNLFTDALKTKLAILMSTALGAKDRTRDLMLINEYQSTISNARFRDNTTGDKTVEGRPYWYEGVSRATEEED